MNNFQEAHGLVGVILDGVCVAIGAEFRVADAEDARLAVFGHGCAAFEDEIGFAIAGVRMDADGLAGFQRDDGHELRTVPQLLSREQIAELRAAFAALCVVLYSSFHHFIGFKHKNTSFMIFCSRLDGLGAVQLLERHHAGQMVRKGHFAHRELQIGHRLDRWIDAERRAD